MIQVAYLQVIVKLLRKEAQVLIVFLQIQEKEIQTLKVLLIIRKMT